MQNRLLMLKQEDQIQDKRIKNKKQKLEKIIDIYNFKKKLEHKVLFIKFELINLREIIIRLKVRDILRKLR